MNEIVLIEIELRLSRLESRVRTAMDVRAELLKHVGVLNRKVELIHDQLTAAKFLEEESPRKNAASKEVAPRAVAGMSQADAQATTPSTQTD